jgi:hypothetical protein
MMGNTEGDDMKKRWLFLIVLSLVLSGCWNLYAGQRPDELGPARWVSENPDIWFEVFDEDPETGYVQPEGQLTYEGNTYAFLVMFDNSKGIVLQSKSNDNIRSLFKGNCKFGPEKLIVTIIPVSDNVFDGKIKVITFIRTEAND